MTSSVNMSATVPDGSIPVHDWHVMANAALKQAIANERSKKWRKVLCSYRIVVELLQRFTMTWSERDRPEWLKILLYEIHFHIGVAMQRMNIHRKAVGQFTKSLESIYVYRGGCRVSTCHSNSCLMTPVYTRRALAHCQSGNMSEALKDAEAAVVLDTRNPDVYCVRSLVRSARKELKEATSDARRALDFDANHICALIIYGRLLDLNNETTARITAKMSHKIDRPSEKPTLCKQHLKAYKLNPDCFNYLSMDSFTHPDIMSFYDRFLFSLCVAHTIFEIRPCQPDLVATISLSDRQDPCRLGENGSRSVAVELGTHPETETCNSRGTTADSAITAMSNDIDKSAGNGSTPQRPWSSTTSTNSAAAARRRNHISTLLLTDPVAAAPPTRHVSSAPNFMAGTCNSYRVATSMSRSVPVRPGSSSLLFDTVPPSHSVTRCPSALELRRTYSESLRSYLQTSVDSCGGMRSSKSFNAKDSKLTRHESASSVKGFTTKVNVQHIPRMYYKPWLGDKLPVNDVQRSKSTLSIISQPFKV